MNPPANSGEPRAASRTGQPPPLPPLAWDPAQMGTDALPRYSPGGPETEKRRSLWRVFFILMGVIFTGLLVLTVIGMLVVGGTGIGGGISLGRKIGLLKIEGMIMQEGGAPYDFWINALRSFGQDNGIRGVVVRINSPGGTVGASQELQASIVNLRRRWSKPVYVSMGDVAASGAYYIAAAADRIYALKGTLTGSIGVVFSKPQISELAKKIGFETETVKSGRFKDAGSIIRPMSEEERTIFNFLIDDTHNQFMEDILLWRSELIQQACQRLSPEQWLAFKFAPVEQPEARAYLSRIADGRVYTGRQALELGLIDAIGSLNDAVEALGRELGFPGRPQIYEPQPRRGLRDLLSARFKGVLGRTEPPLQYIMNLP